MSFFKKCHAHKPKKGKGSYDRDFSIKDLFSNGERGEYFDGKTIKTFPDGYTKELVDEARMLEGDTDDYELADKLERETYTDEEQQRNQCPVCMRSRKTKECNCNAPDEPDVRV